MDKFFKCYYMVEYYVRFISRKIKPIIFISFLTICIMIIFMLVMAFNAVQNASYLIYAPAEHTQWVENQMEKHEQKIYDTTEMFFDELGTKVNYFEQIEDCKSFIYIPECGKNYVYNTDYANSILITKENTEEELYYKIVDLSKTFNDSSIVFYCSKNEYKKSENNPNGNICICKNLYIITNKEEFFYCNVNCQYSIDEYDLAENFIKSTEKSLNILSTTRIQDKVEAEFNKYNFDLNN